MAVGVMGSAGGEMGPDRAERVRRFGEEVGKRGYVLVTGAAPGLPQSAVLGAKAAGGVVIGVSPALNLEEHVHKYNSPTRGYDSIVYTGSGLMGREIENIRTCDVVMFAGGRSGTLGEFAIAYDEGKIIAKKTNAIIRYETDPVRLLDALEEVYEERIIPLHQHILHGHDPDGRPGD
jgi:uncharacterized protein (TIGR00725 family)